MFRAGGEASEAHKLAVRNMSGEKSVFHIRIRNRSR